MANKNTQKKSAKSNADSPSNETRKPQKVESKKDAKKDAKKGSKKDASKNKKPSIPKRFVNYLSNVRLEIKRSTWPTKNEVLNMTIIVVVALLFFGILIFVIDRIMVALLGLYAEFAPNAGE